MSFSFQYANFNAEFNNRTLGFAISRVLPGHFDPRTTNGDRGPGTPAHAQFLSREDFGALWTFSVEGTF